MAFTFIDDTLVSGPRILVPETIQTLFGRLLQLPLELQQQILLDIIDFPSLYEITKRSWRHIVLVSRGRIATIWNYEHMCQKLVKYAYAARLDAIKEACPLLQSSVEYVRQKAEKELWSWKDSLLLLCQQKWEEAKRDQIERLANSCRENPVTIAWIDLLIDAFWRLYDNPEDRDKEKGLWKSVEREYAECMLAVCKRYPFPRGVVEGGAGFGEIGEQEGEEVRIEVAVFILSAGNRS